MKQAGVILPEWDLGGPSMNKGESSRSVGGSGRGRGGMCRAATFNKRKMGGGVSFLHVKDWEKISAPGLKRFVKRYVN